MELSRFINKCNKNTKEDESTIYGIKNCIIRQITDLLNFIIRKQITYLKRARMCCNEIFYVSGDVWFRGNASRLYFRADKPTCLSEPYAW